MGTGEQAAYAAAFGLMSVLVAHPTRQHSHRLARALQDAGLLHSYWTLLPDVRALSWLPARLRVHLPSAVRRHSLEFLSRDKVKYLAGPLILQKVASLIFPKAISQFGEWAAWLIFDRWVASRLKMLRPQVVVGFEMCCLETFRAAKKQGIYCVLDAAAVHHSVQDRVLGEGRSGGNTWVGRRLRQRKRLEIELADRIVCVSKLARLSYIEAGVEPGRVFLNPVGCDLAMFAAPAGKVTRSGPARFVFVGIPAYHKGFDLLALSFERLLVDFPDAELHVVGDARMARSVTCSNRIHIHGKLSHNQLSHLLGSMDCLVLPSRLESFGMVVVEALAAGVAVIVSDHTGASDAIVENENGWLVPAGNGEALLERMLACCRDLSSVRNMGAACVRSAAVHDWLYYSRRAVEILGPILDYGAPEH